MAHPVLWMEPRLGGGRPRGSRASLAHAPNASGLKSGGVVRSSSVSGLCAGPPDGVRQAVDVAGPVESDQVLGGPAAGQGAGCSPALWLYVSKYL